MKSFRKAKGGFPRVAAVAAVLIVTAISTAALLAIPASDSGAPSASSSQLATAGASVSLADLARAFAGAVVTLIVVVLTVAYGRRRIARRRAGGRRRGMHAKASAPRRTAAIKSGTDPFPLNGPADSGGYLSTGDPWPGPPGPYALHPDHPSWPGRPDPRWAATEALPARVRRAFAPRADRTPGTDLDSRPGPMPLREVELTLPGRGLQEDQGAGQPDAPGGARTPA